MSYPEANGYGINENPLINSPFSDNNAPETIIPPVLSFFILLEGNQFLLLDGSDFLLLGS